MGTADNGCDSKESDPQTACGDLGDGSTESEAPLHVVLVDAGSCSMRFVCVRPPAADATELSTSSLQFALDEVQDVLTCGATCCVPVRLRKAAVRSGPHLGVSKHALPASTSLYQP